MWRRLHLGLLGLLLVLSGCVISPRRDTVNNGGNGNGNGNGNGAFGRIYVTNPTNNTLVRFDGALTINGNVAPVAAINGGNTGIRAPTQLVLNNATTTGDLYLADGAAGAVLIFANLGSANGNINATRAISGSNTGLQRASGGAGPFTATGIALDTTR